MAKLEKMGYLEKAHTSSGRMPSRAGFQYFVANSLNLDTIDEQDVYQVVKAFDFEAFKLEDILDAAAKLLAEMTGCTAVIQDVEPTRQRLTGFDIVHLSNHDALAVLTLDESKPVTVQFAIPKISCLVIWKFFISLFKNVFGKHCLRYPLPIEN